MTMNSTSLDKFHKIAGLLGSEHAGERASAALKATAILRAAGKSWADVGVGTAHRQSYDDAGALAMYKIFLDNERARTTDMAKEIGRLKREVARLKGMWPNKDKLKRPECTR